MAAAVIQKPETNFVQKLVILISDGPVFGWLLYSNSTMLKFLKIEKEKTLKIGLSKGLH